MSKNARALTSGQAARYCYVTSDTIVNWIKAKCLPAQRTMGGQYRILIDDLRHFMFRHGMNTELLDDEFEARTYCWETYIHERKKNGVVTDPCEDCLVRKSLAFNCFVLRAVLPDRHWLCSQCRDCEYHQKWHDEETELE